MPTFKYSVDALSDSVASKAGAKTDPVVPSVTDDMLIVVWGVVNTAVPPWEAAVYNPALAVPKAPVAPRNLTAATW